MLLLGAAILALGLGSTVRPISAWAPPTVQIAFFAAFALCRPRSCSGSLRTRFFRTATVARVIERLTRDPRGVRDALAVELGDPTLEVAYWLSERLRRRATAPARRIRAQATC